MLERLLPIITPVLIFAGLELLFFQPSFIYFIVLFLFLVLGGATWKIIGRGLINIGARWLYLITPLFFLRAACSSSFF